MGVRVVHRDHGHAGNRAEAAWEPVAVGGRVQPYHMAAGADLAVHDRAAVIAGERARGQAEDPDQVLADGLQVVVTSSVVVLVTAVSSMIISNVRSRNTTRSHQLAVSVAGRASGNRTSGYRKRGGSSSHSMAARPGTTTSRTH
jgi:hypothetical protein